MASSKACRFPSQAFVSLSLALPRGSGHLVSRVVNKVIFTSNPSDGACNPTNLLSPTILRVVL